MVQLKPDISTAPKSPGVKQRVVIVDDSRSMRKWIKLVLEADPRLVVVGEAADGITARETIRETRPDVVTLDVSMPNMNGLEFLERLMLKFPLPVVMLASQTSKDSGTKNRALALGATDFVAKPRLATDIGFYGDLQERVFKAALSKRILTPNQHNPAPLGLNNNSSLSPKPLVLIGASTGGVAALEAVLSMLNSKGPPVLIVQHMPEYFLKSFVQRLDAILPQNVRLAEDNSVARAGEVLFAPSGGMHTEVNNRHGEWICKLRPETGRAQHVPSVDSLFSSAAHFGHHIISVILTGLGRDGAEGMAMLHRAGAYTIGQDEETSVVYGMPKAAFALGAIRKQLPLGKIGPAVNTATTGFRRLPKLVEDTG